MFNKFLQTFRFWLGGIRLYIALTTLLISLAAWGWAIAAYSGSSLFAIRLTEIYAWLSTTYLATAVSIGPAYKLFKKLPGRQVAFEARRLLGVSAAYYAVLHVAIAYRALFELANPLSLPQSYQRSFLVGSVALVVLLAMAFTSFDKAFKGMGIWWFRLHRLVYVAVLAVLLHLFMSGTHAANKALFVGLAVLSFGVVGMHAYIGFKNRTPTKTRLLTLGSFTTVLVLILIYGFMRGSALIKG
jgi:DMSO/TMAO reductase YedYZ heme-binding membrane subunit